MLVAPKFRAGAHYEEVRPGVYFVRNWNPEFETSQIRTWNLRNYQEFDFEHQLPDGRYLGEYGVCDSPEQLLSLYDFEADPRPLCIFLVKLRKEHEESWGGWRWHKWGEYIGEQKPQCEYLYDEPVIEEVCTYHVYQVVQFAMENGRIIRNF